MGEVCKEEYIILKIYSCLVWEHSTRCWMNYIVINNYAWAILLNSRRSVPRTGFIQLTDVPGR